MHGEEPDWFSEDDLDWSSGEVESRDPGSYLGDEKEFVSLPSGEGFLILSGVGAGSVLEKPPTGAKKVNAPSVGALKSRDEALDGDAPIYMVHRGRLYSKSIPRLLAHLHTSYGQHASLAAIARISSATTKSHQTFFEQASAAALKIADPACYLLDSQILRLSQEPISLRAFQYGKYLSEPEADDWVSRVLDAQRISGANLLLTPGRALNPDKPQESLDAVCAEADQALSLLNGGERLALNLTVPARWLSSEPLRTRLLDQIVDQDQFDTLYVRVQWEQSRVFTPTEDLSLLRGLKKLSNLCLDEDRRLLLPQTGLTGWLCLAFGATGFGIGVSGSDQSFAEYVFRRSAPGRTQVERYFESQLIHTVESSVHRSLAKGDGYVDCSCPYCPALESGAIWSHELAAFHHLHSMGSLTAAVARDSKRGGRYGAVRRIVDAAVRFTEGRPLAQANVPRHLPVWGQIL